MNAQLHRIGNNLFSKDAVTIEISPDSELDFTKVCRSCLRETEDNELENEALFIIKCNGKLARLHEMFEIVTGLKIESNDMLPRHICNSCLQSVKSSFSFRCQSQRANQILESVLLTLKEENPINAFSDENSWKVEEDTIEEQFPVEEKISEDIFQDKQYPDEEMPVDDIIEEIPDQDEEDEHNDIISFDEFSLDESSFNPIEDILHDESEVMSMNKDMQIEIEQLRDIYEQDENSERMVLLKNKNTKFQCEFCDSVFNLQRNLIQHYRGVHPEEKPFKCDICLVSFVHIQSLRRHKNIHAAFPKQKICPYCNRSFSRSDDLTRHKRIHTDERPFGCSICEKAFKQHTELKDHMLSHDDRKMYKCEPCNKEWRSRNGWYVHMKAHQDGRNGRRKPRVKKIE